MFFVVVTQLGSVFCVAVDPIDGGLAVTGGEDDVAYVWNTGSGEVLFKCTGKFTCAMYISFMKSMC